MAFKITILQKKKKPHKVWMRKPTFALNFRLTDWMMLSSNFSKSAVINRAVSHEGYTTRVKANRSSVTEPRTCLRFQSPCFPVQGYSRFPFHSQIGGATWPSSFPASVSMGDICHFQARSRKISYSPFSAHWLATDDKESLKQKI